MAPSTYDGRRPRIPDALGRRIDQVRGGVPFNRWVVDALAAATEVAEGSTASRSPEPTPEFRRRAGSPSLDRFR